LTGVWLQVFSIMKMIFSGLYISEKDVLAIARVLYGL